jgi:hypothetical protein
MVTAMANNPFSLDEEFDSVLLEDRKDIVGRYEALALAYGDYSSRPNNRWLRSLPVVLAPAVESQWTFDSSSSDVFNDMDRDFLESAVSRSGLTLDQIEGGSESTIAVMNSAVGSALELDVNGMFQAGELRVPDGTDAVRLLGRTHPGADFEFLDNSGDVVGLMNTKASSSYSIIAEHFSKHPEVNYVYATHDAAEAAANHGYTVIDGIHGSIPLTSDPVVIDMGMNSTDYREALTGLAENDGDGFLGLFDGESIIDNIPFITLGVLAYRASKRHRNGVEFSENKKELMRDSMKSGTVYGVSGALQAAGVPIPVTMAVSMLSAAAVQGVFRAKDDWAALAATESALVASAESLSHSTVAT